MAKRSGYAARMKINLKPYGFCCPNDERDPYFKYNHHRPIEMSMPSIHSIHESPALRIKEKIIMKRPKELMDDDDDAPPLMGSAVSIHDPSGAMKMNDLTESQISLMLDKERKQRQLEYEERMDRWAIIGERRAKARQIVIKDCCCPWWFLEYSLPQLELLKQLKEVLMRDKKDKQVCRTFHVLVSLGILNEIVRIKLASLKKLLMNFSDDPIKFLYELYKAINGHYFEEEDRLKRDYTISQRIILSGIAFLELPKIILELHKRLPPMYKIEVPPKPKPPKIEIPKKKETPYLEDIQRPFNWRLYETQLTEWLEEYLKIPRPLLILPKKEKKKRFHHDSISEKDDEDNKTLDSKRNSKESKSSIKTLVEEEKSKSVETMKRDDKSKEKIKIKQPDVNKDNKDIDPFPLNTNWTEPPTPCPYKYQKILKETGPLKTDEEFFAALGTKMCKKNFPLGRENLSLNVQYMLLNVEADCHNLMEEANKITGEVKKIVDEIAESEKKCDPCCACRQTKIAHEKWHASKLPHKIVNDVAARNKHPQVIDGTAMHSPAESLSSFGEPICVPSKDKLVKNKVITGTTTLIDGEPVRQIAGIAKDIEHEPHRILRPEVEPIDIRTVPHCECADEEKDKERLDLEPVGIKADVSCFAKKFRPREIPAYCCQDFNKDDDDCGCAEVGICTEDDCGCDDTDECNNEDNDETWDNYNGFEEGWEDVVSSHEPIKPKKKKVQRGDSYDSLEEFLQMDLKKQTCCFPIEENSKRNSKNERRKSLNKSNGPCKLIEDKTSDERRRSSKRSSGSKKERKLSARSERKLRISIRKDDDRRSPIEEKVTDRRKSSTICKEKKDSPEKEKTICPRKYERPDMSLIKDPPEPDENGPYAYRTRSEQALPVQRTIAYLTDLHPPNYPAGQIPVREGGRPCRCRENRNNRKTLLYNIGSLAKDSKEKKEDPTKVIEGILWLTPVPSIRRSDEYIPEYELYDSPFDKQICCGSKRRSKSLTSLRSDNEKTEKSDKKDENDEEKDEDRSKDYSNAFKDEYLNEFFTKKRKKTPCWTKCSRFKKTKKEPRKLRVMNAVCECKYERKLVKRDEERKAWFDRQNRLKSLKKEPYLHVTELTTANLPDSIPEDNEPPNPCDPKPAKLPSAQMVISAITLQTPCTTPSESTEHASLPVVPVNDEKFNKAEEEQEKHGKKESSTKSPQTKSDKSLKKKKSKTEKDYKEKTDENTKQDKNKDENKVENKSESISKQDTVNDETESSNLIKMPDDMSFFDEVEQQWMSEMREICKEMIDEDFISVKLPNYHKMPQLGFWISYRARGLNFSKEYIKKLMEESFEFWKKRGKKTRKQIEAGYFEVPRKKRHLLNFDKAFYWKRKIAKAKVQFYASIREDTVDFGQEMWRSMQFGKFPNLLFKQAYFTYVPSYEFDTYSICPFVCFPS